MRSPVPKKGKSKQTDAETEGLSPGIDGLAKILPIVLAGFALAFDVGYFYSIDIGSFSFFTVSEHVEFAMRALPVAIAGTVMFLLLFFSDNLAKLFSPTTAKIIHEIGREVSCIRHYASRRWVQAVGSVLIVAICGVAGYYMHESNVIGDNVEPFVRRHPGSIMSPTVGVAVGVVVYRIAAFSQFQFIKAFWIGVLVGASLYVAIYRGYYVLATSLVALAVATFIYWHIKERKDVQWKSDELKMQFRVLFISLNLAVLAFFVGFMISMSWYVEQQYSHQASLLTFDDGECVKGQVMHPGEKAIMFYQRNAAGQR